MVYTKEEIDRISAKVDFYHEKKIKIHLNLEPGGNFINGYVISNVQEKKYFFMETLYGNKKRIFIMDVKEIRDYEGDDGYAR